MNLQKIGRIAVIRNMRLGDLIVSLPALEALRRGLPHAHIAAVLSPKVAPLLDKHPHVDEILLDDHLDPPGQLTELLKRGRFDAVLVAACTRRNCWAARAAGVPIRVTDSLDWLSALCGTHRCYRNQRRPPARESSYILSFVHRLGIRFPPSEARPYLYVDPAEKSAIHERIKGAIGNQDPLVGVHPGGASAHNWPVENYFQTIQRLAKTARVIFTGGTSGGKFDQAFESIRSRLTPEMQKRVLPLPDLELPQLVAALSLCDGFVAASTGPLHIAAIVARHCVGLFSEVEDQHPNRWLPVGPNITVLSATANHPDPPPVGSPMADFHMGQITVDMVVQRIQQSLAQSRAA